MRLRPVLTLALVSLAVTASAQEAVRLAPALGAAPAPVLGLSGLDCSAGAATGRVEVPAAPAGAILRFEAGGAAPVPMPNVCADAAPLAVLPDGVRFRLGPAPGADADRLRQFLDDQGDRFRRFAPPPIQIDPDRLRQRLDDARGRFRLLDPVAPDAVAPLGGRR